ncbi:MAG: NUDIX hydrolase [Pseudomonadota bacterium]
MHQNYKFRFCPVCGGKIEPKKIKPLEPARLVCADCAFVFYLDPKLVACSIVEIGEGIVLLKRKHNPQKGRWVVPGGYVDRGETVEAAAVRETREECRIETRIRNLLGVYSYRDSMDVMVFYIAEAVSGELRPGDETLDAELVLPGAIPWDNLAFRSTKDALRDYCGLGDA